MTIDIDVFANAEPIEADLSEKENVIEADVQETSGGVTDYTKLKNKPQLNGIELVGNVNESDPTVPEWAKDNEPKELTKTHIDFVWASIFG